MINASGIYFLLIYASSQHNKSRDLLCITQVLKPYIMAPTCIAVAKFSSASHSSSMAFSRDDTTATSEIKLFMPSTYSDTKKHGVSLDTLGIYHWIKKENHNKEEKTYSQ